MRKKPSSLVRPFLTTAKIEQVDPSKLTDKGKLMFGNAPNKGVHSSVQIGFRQKLAEHARLYGVNPTVRTVWGLTDASSKLFLKQASRVRRALATQSSGKFSQNLALVVFLIFELAG